MRCWLGAPSLQTNWTQYFFPLTLEQLDELEDDGQLDELDDEGQLDELEDDGQLEELDDEGQLDELDDEQEHPEEEELLEPQPEQELELELVESRDKFVQGPWQLEELLDELEQLDELEEELVSRFL